MSVHCTIRKLFQDTSLDELCSQQNLVILKDTATVEQALRVRKRGSVCMPSSSCCCCCVDHLSYTVRPCAMSLGGSPGALMQSWLWGNNGVAAYLC